MNLQPQIESWAPDHDGELGEQSLRRKLEQRGCVCSTYVYPPATRFPPQTHAEDKWDAVLDGRFRISLQGRDFELGPGDCLFVPRGVTHSAAVIGDLAVTSIDAVKIR